MKILVLGSEGMLGHVVKRYFENKGYEVYVVSNACSSRDNLQHAFALQRMNRNGVDVVSSEMVMFEWLEQAGTEEFKEISRKYII